MRRAAFLLPLFVLTAATAGEPNPFAEEDFATRLAAPPVGPPRSKPELERALEFLGSRPASPEAARVAFDVYMTAAVSGNAPLAQDMWRRLAFDHPLSLQHRYLLSVTKPEDYRGRLVEAGRASEFETEFCRQYLVAALAGLSQWRDEFLADGDFQIQIVLAAAELERRRPTFLQPPAADDKAATPNPNGTRPVANGGTQPWRLLRDACRVKLEALDRDSASRRVAAVLFDESLTDVDAVLRLHAIEDGHAARLCEEHFYRRLPPADRESPAVVETRIELLLDRKAYAEALPVVEALFAREATAKRLFWKGLCQAVAGDPAAADTLGSVAERFPDAPWCGPAAEAAAAARDRDGRLDAASEAAAGFFRKLVTGGAGAVEFRADYTPAKGGPLTVYASAVARDGADSAVEVLVTRGGQVVFAVRSSAEGGRVFTSADPSIHAFTERMPVPSAQFDVSFDETTRQYRLNLGAAATNRAAKNGDASLAASAAAVIAKLGLVSASGVRTHLGNLAAKGDFLGPIEADATGRTFTMLGFSPRRPEVVRTRLHLTGDGHVDRFSLPWLTIRDLRYGPADAFVAEPPAWPDRPVVNHAKFDPAVMFQVMAAAMQLWSNDAAEPATAGAEKPGPR